MKLTQKLSSTLQTLGRGLPLELLPSQSHSQEFSKHALTPLQARVLAAAEKWLTNQPEISFMGLNISGAVVLDLVRPLISSMADSELMDLLEKVSVECSRLLNESESPTPSSGGGG